MGPITSNILLGFLSALLSVTLLSNQKYLDTSKSPEKMEIPCLPRDFGHGSVVCVCNSTYCDKLGPLSMKRLAKTKKKFYQITSSKNGKRFYVRLKESAEDYHEKTEAIDLKINRSHHYQKILGFGGAFTDSSGINLASLNPQLVVNEMATSDRQYYGADGLQYNLGRVPMAGTDFSVRTYTYDDIANDTNLENFKLQDEDNLYKIPYLKKALQLNPNLKLISSPWTAPKWMKTNYDFVGKGFLAKQNYDSWARYFIKFLDEYKKQGINIWAVTTQNEPIDGTIPKFSFNCMGWTADEQRDWIKYHLGPALKNSSHSNVHIIIFDDQRAFLLNWSRTVLSDEDAAKYVFAIGVHWYTNFVTSPVVLDIVHNEFPDVMVISTEACVGSFPLEAPVVLGSWERAESYAQDIIENLNHHTVGWIDWNLVLDLRGGPNWAKNYVDAPIIVDKNINVAYKQPTFYAMGHFSKFIKSGSVRVDYRCVNCHELMVSTILGDNSILTMVILNRSGKKKLLKVEDPAISDSLFIEIDGYSIQTILYA